MICPNCHTENRESAKYCDECGFPLQGKIAQVAAEADEALEEGAAADDLGESMRSVVKDSEHQVKDTAFLNAETQMMPVSEEAADRDLQATSVLEPIDLRPSASASGPISKEAIPSIEVAGVNADENGDPYDISDALLDDADFEESPAADDDATGSATKAPVAKKDDAFLNGETQRIDADLSGFEKTMFGDRIENPYQERLIKESDAVQKNNWHDGATMQMPAIEGDETPKSRDFKESSTVKKSGRKTKVIIAIVIAVVVVAAAIAGATYALEIWGGKSIPDVCGMTQSEAQKVLEGQGFTVRSTQVKSDDTEGLVLIMDPVAGSRQSEGSEVVIHVSVARSVPNVVGKTRAEAEALMANEGFEKVTYKEVRSDETEGTVLTVFPDAGTRGRANTEITVEVAVPYTVPDVSDMTSYEAQTAISDAGLSPYIVYVDNENYAEGAVLGTNPEAGEKVTGGSSVAVQVAVHRSSELISATRELIFTGATIQVGSTNYYVTSLDACSYIGNDQTSFTMTASAYVTLLGEMVMGSPRSVSGVITWTSDNQVSSIEAS